MHALCFALYSLSLLCSSANVDLEAELREVLTKKLQRGLTDTTTGSVTTIDFRLILFYLLTTR
jgi:hypothetical protein